MARSETSRDARFIDFDAFKLQHQIRIQLLSCQNSTAKSCADPKACTCIFWEMESLEQDVKTVEVAHTKNMTNLALAWIRIKNLLKNASWCGF